MGEVSAAIDLVTGNNKDGEGIALEKAWLSGRGVRRRETSNYGGGVYGDRDDRESD